MDKRCYVMKSHCVPQGSVLHTFFYEQKNEIASVFGHMHCNQAYADTEKFYRQINIKGTE